MKKNNFLSSLLSAWDLLLDIPIPRGLAQGAGYQSGAPVMPQWTLLAMPVLGLLAALLLELGGAAYGAIFGSPGAALLFALTTTVFLEWKDSGRGTVLLVTAISAKSQKVPLTGLLPQLRAPQLADLTGAVPVLALVLIELFKLGSLFALYHGHATIFLSAMLPLAFAVQGFLGTMPDLATGRPFLSIRAGAESQIFIVAIFIALFVAIRFPAAVLAGAGAILLLSYGMRSLSDKLYGGISAEMITLTGAVAELLLLAAGVLLALK